MSVDKSATERADLNRQIERVERQEGDFSEARERYERSLEQFREQFRAVGRDREASFGEGHQELLSQVDRYVQETAEEVERVRSRIRQSSDDRREKLIAERNGLPWE